MSEPFLAEIKMVGFNFAPRGWAFCDGQILPINQNQSLYSLLGTTYGGDGRTSFALPDLRGRAPMHFGPSNQLGRRAGEEGHVLDESEMPSHSHALQGTTSATNATSPAATLLGATAGGRRGVTPYVAANNLVAMKNTANSGQAQPHENMQPFQVLGFVIALQGLYPSRN